MWVGGSRTADRQAAADVAASLKDGRWASQQRRMREHSARHFGGGARLKAEAPACKTIRAAPVVEYFLDHDNFKHTDGYPGGPHTPQWAAPGTGATA